VSSREAQADLAALSFDVLSAPEVLTSQASPVEVGGKSWTDVLSNRLRIGRGAVRQSGVNDYHHPQNYPLPDENDEDET
jgi:hypothetical protein